MRFRFERLKCALNETRERVSAASSSFLKSVWLKSAGMGSLSTQAMKTFANNDNFIERTAEVN